MSPVMVNIFVEMFKEAITRSKGHRDNTVKIFTVLLEEVENWNNTIIAQHTKEFEAKCTYFSELLAAVFICYVNTLARAIRKRSDDGKQLDVPLPSNADFVHRCLVKAAEMFSMRVQFFREENPHVRSEKLKEVCCAAIRETLDEILPVKDILRTYITGTNFSLGETFEPGPMPEEPQEPEPEEPEEPPAPEEPETKEIPVSLFEDAPDKTSHSSNEQVPPPAVLR